MAFSWAALAHLTLGIQNQARRLLNDIASFRGYLDHKDGRPVSETVAAHRWLEDVYDPAVAAIPDGLRDRLSPPEIFHEILEHRWYLSGQAGRDVGNTAAAQSHFDTVLPQVPQPLTTAAEDGTEPAPSAAAGPAGAAADIPDVEGDRPPDMA